MDKFKKKQARPSHSRERSTARNLLPLIQTSHVLLVAVILLSCAVANARWTRVDSGSLSWLYSVYFLDGRTGWIAGSKGTFLRSSDAGAHWTQTKRFTDDNIRDVHFSDAKSGWILCDHAPYNSDGAPASYLLHTTDGGISWERVDFKESRDRLVRLFFTKEGYGFAIGEGGGIWQMLDDRKSWKRVDLPVRFLIQAGQLLDDFNGVLVGGGGTILTTSDGGIQWSSATILQKTAKRLNSVFFLNRKIGWTVGSGGNIYFTGNGGRTWSAQESGVKSDLYDVWFLDTSNGYAVGDGGTIIRTRDGGTVWTPEESGGKERLERVFFTGGKGFAVGFGGTILTTATASDS